MFRSKLKLKQKVKNYERELEEKNEKLKQKDREIYETRLSFYNFKKDSESLIMKNKEIIGALDRRLDSLENCMLKKEREAICLDDQRKKLEELFERLQREDSAKTIVLKEKEKNIELQESKLRKYKEILKNMELDVEEKTKNIKEYEKKIKVIENKLKKCERSLEDKNKEETHLKRDIENRIKETYMLKETLSNKNKETITLTDELKNTNEEINKLKENIELKMSELNKVVEENENWKRQTDILNQKILILNSNIEDFELEEKNKKIKIKDLQSEIILKNDEIERLRKDISVQIAKTHHLDINQKEIIGQLKKELYEKIVEVEQLERDISVQSNKFDELESKQKVLIDQLQRELITKSKEISSLGDKISLERTRNIELEVNQQRMQESLDNLEKMLDNNKKEMLEKNQEIKSLQNNISRLCKIEQNVKEAESKIFNLKNEVEEKNNIIANCKLELSDKVKNINKLEVSIDILNSDIEAKIELIKKLELKYKSLETEYTKKEQCDIRTCDIEDEVIKLKDQITYYEKLINLQSDDMENMKKKLIESDQLYREMEVKYNIDIEHIKDQFSKLVESNNMTIQNLETFKIQALENMTHKDETIKKVQKLLLEKELEVLNVQEELFVLNKNFEEKKRQNDILEFKVNKINELKNKEIETIEENVRKQFKIINDAYQFECETKEYEEVEFIRKLETCVSEQIADHELKLKMIDNLHETVENLVLNTNEKIDVCGLKMKDSKRHLETLQKIITEQQFHIKDIKDELTKKDTLCNRLKEQMANSIQQIQGELSHMDLNARETLTKSCTDYDAVIQFICDYIHANNETMSRLNEDLKNKDDTITNLEEKHRKLLDRIKVVVIAITNTKLAFLELREETNKLKGTLVGSKKCGVKSNDSKSKITEIFQDNLSKISEENSENVSKLDGAADLSNQVVANLECENIASQLQSLCSEMASIREEYEKICLQATFEQPYQ
jgi:hypothetical protein